VGSRQARLEALLGVPLVSWVSDITQHCPPECHKSTPTSKASSPPPPPPFRFSLQYRGQGQVSPRRCLSSQWQLLGADLCSSLPRSLCLLGPALGGHLLDFLPPRKSLALPNVPTMTHNGMIYLINSQPCLSQSFFFISLLYSFPLVVMVSRGISVPFIQSAPGRKTRLRSSPKTRPLPRITTERFPVPGFKYLTSCYS